MNLHLKQLSLLLVASLALTRSSLADPSQTNTNINEIDDKIPEKPEPRQIGGVMPYTWLQPPQAVVAAAPALPSSWGLSSPSWWSSLGSGQSLMSLFRPNVVGGRRSSLTSRLRNLMNALFYRRETTSPYLTSGSSYSYSFRPPPFGFGSGFPTTGLTSALNNQNLYGSASLNRPVVLSNYGSSPAVDAWSNYKQYGSGGSSLPASWGSGGSGTGSSSGNIWQSGSSSGTGPQYSALSSSSFPSFSSGSGSSNSAYQAAASNVYPQTSYQRSSISSYSKPQPSASTSVSSSVSVSSSSSSSSNPKSVGFQSN